LKQITEGFRTWHPFYVSGRVSTQFEQAIEQARIWGRGWSFGATGATPEHLLILRRGSPKTGKPVFDPGKRATEFFPELRTRPIRVEAT
jgi:hypothetical protein